jgi:hypothetical protein
MQNFNIFLSSGRLPFWIYKFLLSLNIVRKFKSGWAHLSAAHFLLPPRPSNHTCATYHGAIHQAVTVLTVLSAAKPATTGRRPTWRGFIPARGRHQRNRAPLCLLSQPHCLVFTSALLASERHHRPPPFLSEPTRRTVVPTTTSRTRSMLEPTAIASGLSTSSIAASSPMSSLLLAVVCAPSTLPSLRGRPHDLVALLRPHLRR